jgi:hypothetical protein
MDDIDWDNFEEDLLALLQEYGMDPTTLESVVQYAAKFQRGLKTMIKRQELVSQDSESRDD